MFGKYKHAVDPKGRLFVPAKLREELGDAFYVTLGLDHCLSVYTEEGWQAIVDRYNALPISQSRKMRFLFANAAKCEPDKQGRFSLPAELRQYAGLGQDVTFIGQGGHAEIWDSAAYDALEQETLTPENLAAAMEELGF
ncbi:MAG TPA: division/cell wall cluster transcriptional repressor MraZ [Candidatus Avoscillospira avistercoris]|uniref:Transcriptional regulator MraZ n=1 Tax=Candidatus Avoscillospira avistercoris TaxID=2840707 RepID=A0A9D1JTS5_9FIRM|nr:division/cell wall cluster transcriptional repressor MraZ [Candidatus Avoscillospira avistercoris]